MLSRRSGTQFVLIVLALAGVAGCGDSSTDSPEHPSASPSIDIPSDVTVTEAGTTLSSDESASIVWDAGANATSVITVRVKKVKRGKIKDFRFFSLTDEQKDATPYYVHLNVVNEGPAGLGGKVPPIQLRNGDDASRPNPINGKLKPCQTRKLPKSFLPDDKADVCLVYLTHEKPKRIELQGQPGVEAVHWKVPSDAK